MSDDKPSYKGYVNRKFTASKTYRSNYDGIFGKKDKVIDMEGMSMDDIIKELSPILEAVAQLEEEEEEIDKKYGVVDEVRY